MFQTLKHGTHIGRQVDGTGASADAGRLTIGDPAPEGARQVKCNDAPSAYGQADGITGTS